MREYLVNINEKSYKVTVKNFGVDVVDLEINGKLYSVKLDEPVQEISGHAPSAPSASPRPVATRAAAPVQAAPSAAPVQAAASGGAEIIKAPIPGSILGIMCKEGDKIQAGQSVIKMEAMKMENEIKATVGGVVEQIIVSIGDAVGQGDDMILIKKDA